MGLSIEEAKVRLKKLILAIEAHANEVIAEINNEADFEYTLEKRTASVQPKLEIDEEFRKHILIRRTEIFTKHNRYLNMKRFEVLEFVENMFTEMVSETKRRVIRALEKKSHIEHYRAIFGALILQGLCKLLENIVIIRIRQQDIPILTSVIKKKIKDFEDLTKMCCKVYLDKEFLPIESFGGLFIFNKKRNVFIDNSLLKRVDYVSEKIRPMLKEKIKKYGKDRSHTKTP